MKKFIALLSLTALFTGCATVPTSSVETSQKLKQAQTLGEGKSGLYIYRSNSVVGAALKKDIWLDKECVGESARGVFFYKEVAGNQEHTLATESEFSPNLLTIKTDAGKNYFVQQYIKVGLVTGGANLKLVNEKEGMAAIQELTLAEQGKCSEPYPNK